MTNIFQWLVIQLGLSIKLFREHLFAARIRHWILNYSLLVYKKEYRIIVLFSTWFRPSKLSYTQNGEKLLRTPCYSTYSLLGAVVGGLTLGSFFRPIASVNYGLTQDDRYVTLRECSSSFNQNVYVFCFPSTKPINSPSSDSIQSNLVFSNTALVIFDVESKTVHNRLLLRSAEISYNCDINWLIITASKFVFDFNFCTAKEIWRTVPF